MFDSFSCTFTKCLFKVMTIVAVVVKAGNGVFLAEDKERFQVKPYF